MRTPTTRRVRACPHQLQSDRELGQSPARGKGGFTLLEILLALGLGAVVLAAIAMAVDVHWRALQAGRRDVEEAQLARAVLGRMANDIRGAVQYDPQQAEKMLTSVVPSSASASSAAAALTGNSSSSGSSSASSSDTPSSESSADASSSESSGTSNGPRSVPALYGSADTLEVDVSRLPRLDQINSFLADTSDSMAGGQASDVKTIAYYLANATGSIGRSSASGPQTGLIRREVDRAITAFAVEQGTVDSIDSSAKPLAEEIDSLGFRYFDGANWTTEWDSVAAGGLPTAVEISVSIKRPAPNAGASSWLGVAASGDAQSSSVYRLVVGLPGAHAPAKPCDTPTEDTEDQSGDSSDSGSSQASGSSSGGTSTASGGANATGGARNTGSNTGGKSGSGSTGSSGNTGGKSSTGGNTGGKSSTGTGSGAAGGSTGKSSTGSGATGS